MTYYIATRSLGKKGHFKPVKVFGAQAAFAGKEFATHYNTVEEAYTVAAKLSLEYHATNEFKVKEAK